MKATHCIEGTDPGISCNQLRQHIALKEPIQELAAIKRQHIALKEPIQELAAINKATHCIEGTDPGISCNQTN